jgi:hypothetical protein
MSHPNLSKIPNGWYLIGFVFVSWAVVGGIFYLAYCLFVGLP